MTGIHTTFGFLIYGLRNGNPGFSSLSTFAPGEGTQMSFGIYYHLHIFIQQQSRLTFFKYPYIRKPPDVTSYAVGQLSVSYSQTKIIMFY